MTSDFDFNLMDLSLLDNLDIGNMEDFLTELQSSYPKPMHEWESKEVLDFILNEISPILNEVKSEYFERFHCISGYIFKNLTEENCKLLANSPYIGGIIFNAKEKYIRCHPNETLDHYYEDENSENSSFFNDFNRFADSDSIFRKNIKRPGRPRCKSFNTNRNGKRSEKLWEFLLHLLQDDKTCPQLIKWENFEEGTFKFVESNKVARLWGNRKKNENMTYEKFSRAMRYYYKSKVLLPVPGKRLVYRFGPQAKGWKNLTPIIP